MISSDFLGFSSERGKRKSRLAPSTGTPLRSCTLPLFVALDRRMYSSDGSNYALSGLLIHAPARSSQPGSKQEGFLSQSDGFLSRIFWYIFWYISSIFLGYKYIPWIQLWSRYIPYVSWKTSIDIERIQRLRCIPRARAGYIST